jgi:tetratricopeptide (TPR) repeat protein
MRAHRSAFLFLSVFPCFSVLVLPPLALGAQSAPKQNSEVVKATVAPTTAPDYSKEPYVVELLETDLRFEADGRNQRELTLRIRMQSESAVRQFGLLIYPFAASFETLDVVYARARKPDGTVIDTPASDVQELDSAVSREAPMYTDEREKHIAIKSLTPGDVLEAKLRWTVHDPIAPGHFWFDDDYFKAGICLQEIVQVDVPKATAAKLHYSEPQPTIREEGERRIYTFQTAHPKKEEGSKIPEWEKNFYGADPPGLRISSFTSWAEVGEWYSALEKPKTAVTPAIRAKAEEITKGKTSDEEKTRALYDFVSTHIRYIGVDLGKGRYTPHSAEDVLANRYGDCKDKHTLLAALLQAEGIPAYPVLISSRFRVDDAFPSADLFDHVITAVPKGDGLVFLDTTPEVAPYGMLVNALRARQALVIPSDKSAKLESTPAELPFRNYELFHIDSSIDVKGTLDAKMRMEERGDSEVELRAAYRATPQNKWEELTQTLVGRMGFLGTVSDVSVGQPEDTAKPFILEFSYHRTEFPDWKNRRILLPAPFFFVAELTEEQKSSKNVLPMGTPVDVTYETTVKLPDKFFVLRPEDVEEKSDFAEFSAKYSVDKEKVLHGTLHLKTLLTEIPGPERTKFSELAKAVSETSRRYIFVRGEFPGGIIGGVLPGLATRGPEVMAKLEQMAAEQPENQQLTMILGQRYITEGRAKDAVALFEKALEKEPKETSVLYYGLGKAYLALADGEKAFENYQKALGDDPEPAQLNNIAWDLGDGGVHMNDALGYAERAVEAMVEKSRDASADDADTADFVLMRELAASWDTLGWIKFRQGDAATALPYLQASWDLAQGSAVGEHLVEVDEKLGKPQKAAAICNMALAGYGDAKVHEKLSGEMEHLRRYLKPPASKSETLDGSMALSDVRTLHIPFHAKLSGKTDSAHFVISIVNGPKADNVVFSSGDAELQNAVASIAAAKYPQSFPEGTPTRILRKATLSCSIYTKDCVLVLLPVADAAVPEN